MQCANTYALSLNTCLSCLQADRPLPVLKDPRSMRATEILDALGGDMAVSVRLGVHRCTVTQWHKRGIPSDWALELHSFARELRLFSITLEDILKAMPRLHARAPALPEASFIRRPRRGKTLAVG
jgi:hypothetical protein